MKWLRNRLSEPSTYGGLPVLIVGLLTMLDVPQAEQVGGVVTTAATDLIAGNPVGAGFALLGGLLAIFLPEKHRT